MPVDIRCNTCGIVRLGSTQITIVSLRGVPTYIDFPCPGCQMNRRTKLDPDSLRFIRTPDIRNSAKWISADGHTPKEAKEIHTGEPLTYDDLLDLHQELVATDLVAELIGGDYAESEADTERDQSPDGQSG